ncbi:MAG: NHL repeat-containing protein [bacterium]
MPQIKKSALHFLIFGLVILCSVKIAQGQPTGWQGKTENMEGVEYIYNPEQGLWEHESKPALKIKRIFSIGKASNKAEKNLGWVQDIATDSAGNIYICDSRKNQIVIYDRKGKFIRAIGGSRKGAAQLRRPSQVTIGPNGFLFVLDALNYRIAIFDASGNFVKSLGYNGYAGGFAVDSNGNVLLTFARLREGYERPLPNVTVLDDSGKMIWEFGEPIVVIKQDYYGQKRFAWNGLAVRDYSTLLVSFSYPYMIHFYKGAMLQKAVFRESPIFTKPELVGREGPGLVMQRSYIWDLLVLPHGKIAAFIRDAGQNYAQPTSDREFETHVDLFDADGYFLASYPWDWRKLGLIKHVDREGYFYSNFGETEIVPGVTKYRVEFN